jgi:hypothetical protein
MKTKQIFWGVFLISIGILILLRNYLNLDFELGDIWKLWPLVFVLVGVNLMIRNDTAKSIVSGLTGFILAVALYASVAGIFGWIRDDVDFRFDDSDFEISEYTTPYEKGIRNASLQVEAGAGSFVMNDSTELLFSASVEGKNNKYSLTANTDDESADLLFKMKSAKFFIKNKNRVELKLNTAPLWDLNFDIGAAAADFDLSSYNIESLDIEMGAASLKLKLGDINPESHIKIDAGASSIDILIPENAGCEIHTEASLSSKSFTGFTKISENLYRTENFKDASKKILLNMHSGISSINVNRYTW